MKKLLILLLLSTSFSTFGSEIVPLVPCDGEDFIRKNLIEEKKQNWEKRYITLEDQSLSDAEKVEQIKGIDERILEIDTYLSDLANNCKQSPEGSLINNLREGKWTWYDQYNRVIKEGNYVNGLKEGSWTEWIYTGETLNSTTVSTIQMNYKNDKLEGKWTNWYDQMGSIYNTDRRKMIELMIAVLKKEHTEIWVESQLSDEPKKYESKLSELVEQIQHIESQIKELRKPRIIEEGNYINGKKEGTWTYWRRVGIIGIEKEEEIYEDGVLIE